MEAQDDKVINCSEQHSQQEPEREGGNGMCGELVMHSGGRCGCREQRLFTHHPHCPSHTLGNTSGLAFKQRLLGSPALTLVPMHIALYFPDQVPHSAVGAAAQAAQIILLASAAAAPQLHTTVPS